MAITKLLHIGEAGGKNPSASLYEFGVSGTTIH